MKEKWLNEQMSQYEGLSKDQFKKKVIKDLLEAIDWAVNDDFESCYRMAGGAVKALFEKQDTLK